MPRTSITIPVRCTEIDVNGHVNNAKYLEYYEWGREDWYEEHGLPYDVLHEAGVVTVVARAEVDYRVAAKQNDLLQITSWVHKIGNTSFRMRQRIVRDDSTLISEAVFVIVTTDPSTGKSVKVPESIARHVESDGEATN